MNTRLVNGRRMFTLDTELAHATLRQCEGRRWHGNGTWSLPAGPRADRIARQLGLVLPPEVLHPLHLPAVDPAYWDAFRPYQQDGVRWLQPRTHALLWDEPGLGKTRQSLAWSAGYNTIVACPLAVVDQWVEEARRAVVSRTLSVVDQKGRLRTLWGTGEAPIWIVSNYERCSKLNPTGMFRLIVDEATYIKGAKTKRTKEVQRLGQRAVGVLALTGHPMVNRPIDLWPLFLLLKQRTEKEFWPWVNTYCGAIQTPYGWDFSGATRIGDLRDDLAGFGLRREAKDVLDDLPDYTEEDLRVPEPELERIEVCWQEVLEYHRRGEALDFGEGYASLQHLRMECAASKVPFAAKWLEQHFAGGGGKALVFSTFKAPLRALAEHTPGMRVYDGDVAEADRADILRTFRDDPNHKTLGLTYGIGALGLNLQHANTLLRLDFPWTPLEYDQSIKRLVRIGQRSNVRCVNLLSGHPVEGQMRTGLDFKQELVDALKSYADQLFLTETDI